MASAGAVGRRRSVNPGERIGILGRNGAGKSTLMKLISGALPPSGGDRVASPDLIVGNFAQLEVDRLDSRDTALIALDQPHRRDGRAFPMGRAAPPQSPRRLRLPRRPGVRARGPLLRRRARAPGARDPGRRAPQPAAARRAYQPSRLRDAPFADHRVAGVCRGRDRGLARSRPAAQRLRPVLAGGGRRWSPTSTATSTTTPPGWKSAAAPPRRLPHPKPAATAATKGADKKREKRRARNDVAPKRQEIKSIETSLDKLGQERAKLEKELAGIDFTRDAAACAKSHRTPRSSQS